MNTDDSATAIAYAIIIGVLIALTVVAVLGLMGWGGPDFAAG